MNSTIKVAPLDDSIRAEESTHNESSIFFNTLGDPNETAGGYEHIDLKVEKDEIYTNDIAFGNPITNKTPKRIGNLYVFFYNKNGEPIIVIGPHWPFFACLFTTISIVSFIFFYCLWDVIGPHVRSVGLFIYACQISSYLFIFLKNPGLPLLRQQLRTMPNKVDIGFRFCDQCHIMVNIEEETTHCDDCNVCIIGYDHHCPWTSKCIGKGNLTGFYTFITFTMILFGYFIYAISMMNVHK